jgi:hypothetical protein
MGEMLGNMKGRYHLQDLAVDGKTVTKMDPRKQDVIG